MTARYDLYENPDPQKSGEKKPMHARFVPSGKLTAEMLYSRAAHGSTFTPGELEGALKLLTDTALRELANGNSVELGELGTLTFSLESRPVGNKTEIRAASVHVKNINLRTSSKIKKRISATKLERNPDSWRSSGLDVTARDQKLKAYLAEHSFMHRQDYQKLRACKPGIALKELNELIRQGRIIRQGARGSSFYVAAEGYSGK